MDTRPRSKMLMSADETAVLVVDVQDDLGFAPVNASHEDAWSGLASVLQLAEHLSVPVTSTLLNGANRDAPEPLDVISHLTHIARSEPNPWEHAAVRETLSDLARDAIVIAGNCAEGGVSFAALGALEHGYQSYVVVDAIGAATELELTTALGRWTQAGSIAVTSRQVLLEWRR